MSEVLAERMIQLATRYGRYGYRRITALLRREGWQVNHKRVQRIWRREGLKVPSAAPEAGTIVAERWFLHQASPGTSEPCMDLRLRSWADQGWPGLPHDDRA